MRIDGSTVLVREQTTVEASSGGVAGTTAVGARAFAAEILRNGYLNGEPIRLDGAHRTAPR